jgi:hypothetical protein
MSLSVAEHDDPALGNYMVDYFIHAKVKIFYIIESTDI